MYQTDTAEFTHINALIQNNILTSPAIKNGEPIIIGTGVTVQDVVSLFNIGYSIKAITKQFTSIDNEEQVLAAILYHVLQSANADEVQEKLLTLCKTLLTVLHGRKEIGFAGYIILEGIMDAVKQLDPAFKIYTE